MSECENHGQEVRIRDFKKAVPNEAVCVPCNESLTVYLINYVRMGGTDIYRVRNGEDKTPYWAI